MDEVKDHIEFLYLGVESPDNKFPTNSKNCLVDLRIPKMKKLKDFGNFMIELFNWADKLRDICTARIQTLQTLRISTCTRKAGLNRLLGRVIEEKGLFSGVKNLHVQNLYDDEIVAGLKTPFPNLESLSIHKFRYDGSSLYEVEI